MDWNNQDFIVFSSLKRLPKRNEAQAKKSAVTKTKFEKIKKSSFIIQKIKNYYKALITDNVML